MEFGFWKFAGEILRSPTRLGIFIVLILLVIYAASKLLPMVLTYWRDIQALKVKEKSDAAARAIAEREAAAQREKEHDDAMLKLLRDEFDAGQKRAEQQSQVLNVNTVALSECANGIKEVISRTATVESSLRIMCETMANIKGYIEARK